MVIATKSSRTTEGDTRIMTIDQVSLSITSLAADGDRNQVIKQQPKVIPGSWPSQQLSITILAADGDRSQVINNNRRWYQDHDRVSLCITSLAGWWSWRTLRSSLISLRITTKTVNINIDDSFSKSLYKLILT